MSPLVIGASLWVAATPYGLDAPLPGPDSAATAWVRQTLTAWPPTLRSAEAELSAPLRLTCLATPGRSQMVGVWQEMLIAAPLAAVSRVVDDFAGYPALYPDLAKVQVVQGSRDRNRFTVAWENEIPVFFIPNVTYQTTYQVDAAPERVSYLYKLVAKGTVKATDGFVVLEALGPGKTRFTEVDFVEADFGPFSEASAWAMSVTGFFRTDVALKLKAERPALTAAQAKAEAKRLSEAYPAEACYRGRRPRPNP